MWRSLLYDGVQYTCLVWWSMLSLTKKAYKAETNGSKIFLFGANKVIWTSQILHKTDNFCHVLNLKYIYYMSGFAILFLLFWFGFIHLSSRWLAAWGLLCAEIWSQYLFPHCVFLPSSGTGLEHRNSRNKRLYPWVSHLKSLSRLLNLSSPTSE